MSRECKRAELSKENLQSFFETKLGNGLVSSGLAKKRSLACAKCDMLCRDFYGFFCGAGCGCAVAPPNNVLTPLTILGTILKVDLTLYSEYPKGHKNERDKFDPLCKHSRRGEPNDSGGTYGWPVGEE